MLVPFSAAGITLERSVPTRSAVDCSAGPLLATALKKATVPAGLICTGVTATTPGVCDTSFSSVASRGSLARGSLPELPELAEPEELPELPELAEPDELPELAELDELAELPELPELAEPELGEEEA